MRGAAGQNAWIRRLRALGLLVAVATLFPSSDARSQQVVGRPALGFVESSGAADGFELHGQAWRVTFTAGSVVFEPKGGAGGPSLRRWFPGARQDVRPIASEALPGVWNVLLGLPESWRTCRPHWGHLRYPDLYPGVDLVFETRGRELKATFLVAPGVDARVIRIRHDGPHEARVEADGRLVFDTPAGTLVEDAPVAWQEVGGQRIAVDCRHAVLPSGDVTFRLGRHDPTRPLVIDPELAFATLIEGDSWDGAFALHPASDGSFVVAGHTRSSDFPVTPGAVDPINEGDERFDLWVAGFGPDAADLRFCTLLGGSLHDRFGGLQVGSDGTIYLAGTTESPDFPTTPGAFGTDARFASVFVSALSPTGDALVFSSVFGSSTADRGAGLVLQGDRLYVGGWTGQSEFPTTPGVLDRIVELNAVDVFVSVLSLDGAELLQSTLVGETGAAKAAALAVANDGTVIVAGNYSPYSVSWFPTTPGAFQPACPDSSRSCPFVLRLNADFTELVSATFITGSVSDVVYGAHVDRWGNAYITGETESPDFPTTPGAFDEVHGGEFEVFVTKVAPDGRSLLYSTLLGDAEIGRANGITVDSAGVAHVTGYTQPAGFPTTSDAFDPVGGEGMDAFFTSVAPGGESLLYSTLLGGVGHDEAFAAAFDRRGGVFLVGSTTSADFPTTPGVWDEELTPSTQAAAFIAKFQLDCPPEPPLPGGPALRLSRPGDPDSPEVLLDWSADTAQPRPYDEHFHVLSGSDARSLSVVPGTEPWLDLTALLTAEPSAALPAVTYYRIDVADRCEQSAPLWR